MDILTIYILSYMMFGNDNEKNICFQVIEFAKTTLMSSKA